MPFLDFLKNKKTDKSSIVSQVNELFDRDEQDYSRKIIDRIVFRNILYLCGEQWIEYSRSLGSFRRRNIPPYVPTPVSNEVRDFVRTVRSMLMSQKLVPKILPNTNELEDQSAAILGEQLLIWMDQINDGAFIDEKEKVADWMVIAGTGFMRCFPKMDSGRWFTTKDGIIKEGDVCAEAVIPFNVVVDPMGDTLQKKRWVGIKSLKYKEWVEDTFKVKINSSGGDLTTVDYEKRLMKLVSQVSPWKGAGLEAYAVSYEDSDLVLFKEVEFQPTDEYPNGRYIVTCNNQLIVDMKRMIVKSSPGAWFYSLTDFHYNRVPGRFWSDSGINDLISPQNAINEIDQMLAINRKSLGRNRVTYPTGTVIKRINEGGAGFMAFEFDPRTTGGQAPQIMQGVPLPPQMLEERMVQKSQFQDSAGDPKNILKGQAPSSQSSGVQVDILRETAERTHTPDVDRFNRSLTRVYKKRLLLAQEIYTEPRVAKIVGKGQGIEIKEFLGSDLRDNTDVKLELDNGLSTTKSGQVQLLLDMANKGYLGDLVQDPEIRAEFLRRVGLSGFSEKINVDVARAERENSQIAMGDFKNVFLLDDEPQEETGEPTVLQPDPLFALDNHELHYETHRRAIVGAEYRDWPQEAQLVLLKHAQSHKQAIAVQAEDKVKRGNLAENVAVDRLMSLLTESEKSQLLAQLGIQADPIRGENPDAVPKIIPSNEDKFREKEMDTAMRSQMDKQKFVLDRASAEHDTILDDNWSENEARRKQDIERVKAEVKPEKPKKEK